MARRRTDGTEDHIELGLGTAVNSAAAGFREVSLSRTEDGIRLRNREERQQLYERGDGGARSLPRLFSGTGGSVADAVHRCKRLADDLLFWPQRPILVGYLAQLAYVPLEQRSGGIGKYGQIFGALSPYGEQVKTPGRSSQMGRLR